MALQRLDAACLSAITHQLRHKTRTALRASSICLCRCVNESITALRLRDEDWNEGQEVSLSKFATLRSLELSAGSCADAEDVVYFLCEQQAQHLAGLRSLKLTGCSYSIQDLHLICTCLPGLTSLTAVVSSSSGNDAEVLLDSTASTISSSSRSGLLELDLAGSYQLSEACISTLLCLSTQVHAHDHNSKACSSICPTSSAPLRPSSTRSQPSSSSPPADAAPGSSSSGRQPPLRLQRLCLKTCLAVGPRLGFLGAVPYLQHLDLHGCFKVNDTSLRALAAHCSSTSATLNTTSKPSSSIGTRSSSSSNACTASLGERASSTSNGVGEEASAAVVTHSEQDGGGRWPGEHHPATTAAAAAAADAPMVSDIPRMAVLSLAPSHPTLQQQQQQQEADEQRQQEDNKRQQGENEQQQDHKQGVGQQQQQQQDDKEKGQQQQQQQQHPMPASTAAGSTCHQQQALNAPTPQQQQRNAALRHAPAPGPAAAPAGCHLSYLNLSYTRVTDQGMAALARLQGLRHLGLKGANVGDDGLLHLTRLTALTALQVKHCHRITEEGIAWLAPLDQLQLLSFGYTSMPEADAIAALLASNHPCLTALDLLSDQLSDAGLKSLGRLAALQTLKLYQPGVTVGGLEQLAGSPAGGCLEGLTLYGAGHVKELTPLCGLGNLRSLHLGDSRLARPALAHLTALTHLHQLSLEGEQALDRNLLQQLLVAGRLQLWEVRVRGCPGVSREQVEELVRGDPGAVTRVWYAPSVDPSTDDEEDGWTLCTGHEEEEY